MVLIMWLCRKMVIPHMTTFDPQGSRELIQGMDFHKKKFEEGIDDMFRCVSYSTFSCIVV